MKIAFRSVLLAVGLTLVLGFPALVSVEARPRLSPEAAKVAEDFLFAFSRNDRDAVTAMLPRQLHNLYGPSPFTHLPTLTKPRADKRTGAVEFQGGRADAGVPDRGLFVLRRMTEGGQTVWRVRQIYWYDELPPDANLPEKSRTAADRREEPRLREAVTEFIKVWMAREYENLDSRVFHWWEVDRKAPKWVKMNRVNLRDPATSLGGVRLDFTAKLRVLGALPKSVDGTMWLVEEGGKWRVRPLTFAFAF